MCPCVLLEKLKRVVGKKKKSKKDTTSNSNSGKTGGDSNGDESKAGPDVAQSKSKTTKKSQKKESKKKERKKENQQSTTGSLASLDSDQSKSCLNVCTGEKLGQVVCNKPDPKSFLKRILEAERPDLFERTELNDREYLTIENYLVQQGEMRIGVDVYLGKITDCDNTSDKVGEGDSMTVKQMYANGRFGAVYLVQRESSAKSMANIPKGLALKMGRRMGTTAKVEDEIRILRRMQEKQPDLKDSPRPTHITPMLFSGVTGGAPFLVMQMMDANLTKIRQETGYKWPWVDAFYVAQEAMIGMRECHERTIVHRDIKPTNLLLSTTDSRKWWLCDFGDACRIGEKKKLSPPDALTLPFVSRAGHRAVTETTPATIAMDIESWFYMLLELFVALPWNSLIEEEETLVAKNAFWTSTNSFFEKNSDKLPTQIQKISGIVADPTNTRPYAQIQALLREGYTKYNVTPPWKPIWEQKRAVLVVKTPVAQPALTGKLKTVIPKDVPKEVAIPSLSKTASKTK